MKKPKKQAVNVRNNVVQEFDDMGKEIDGYQSQKVNDITNSLNDYGLKVHRLV